MRYIKTYENIKYFESEKKGYQVGDYVYLNEQYMKNLFPKLKNIQTYPKFAKIINVDENPIRNTSGDWISITTYLAISSSGVKFIILDDAIIRKLRPKEIEQFEIFSTSNKYNL